MTPSQFDPFGAEKVQVQNGHYSVNNTIGNVNVSGSLDRIGSLNMIGSVDEMGSINVIGSLT